MSNKVFAAVCTITSGAIAIAEGVISLFDFPWQAAVVASLPILEGAIIGICANFKAKEAKKTK